MERRNFIKNALALAGTGTLPGTWDKHVGRMAEKQNPWAQSYGDEFARGFARADQDSSEELPRKRNGAA